MTKAIQEKVILNEIKEISLNRIGGNIPKYFDDKQDCISALRKDIRCRGQHG